MHEHNLRTRGRGEQVVLLPLQADDAVDMGLITSGGNALRSKNSNGNSTSSTGKRGSSWMPSMAELVLLVGSACFLLFVLKTTRSPNELLRVKQAATPAQSTSRHSPNDLLQSQKANPPFRKTLSASKTPLVTKPATTTKATSSSDNNKVSVAGIDPIACSSFLESVRKGTYPVVFQDPNREQLPGGKFNKTDFTRMTLTENPFWISVHHRMADKVRWTMYKEGKYYEWALEKLWSDVLKKSGPGARILDVGYVLLVTASLWIHNAGAACIIVWCVLVLMLNSVWC
jgi:hypothetical protein